MENNKPNISFFCPAYFDAQNLPRLIPVVIETLREVAGQFEIVIVEDGSPDNTGAVADDLQRQFAGTDITVIHHPKNTGYGGALVDGFNSASKYEWVFTTDGDMQYDPKEFKGFLPYMNDYDAIVGYRLSRKLSQYRKLQTYVYNFMIHLMFRLKIKDINCSFKVVRRQFLNKFELKSASSFIDAELLLKLRKNKARIMELPVNHFPRMYGEASGAKPGVVLTTLKEMFQYLFTGRL